MLPREFADWFKNGRRHCAAVKICCMTHASKPVTSSKQSNPVVGKNFCNSILADTCIDSWRVINLGISWVVNVSSEIQMFSSFRLILLLQKTEGRSNSFWKQNYSLFQTFIVLKFIFKVVSFPVQQSMAIKDQSTLCLNKKELLYVFQLNHKKFFCFVKTAFTMMYLVWRSV